MFPLEEEGFLEIQETFPPELEPFPGNEETFPH
jgi:hypothetical protein